MIVPTHRKIAKKLYKQFSPEIQRQVNKKMFFVGAMHPDISIKYKKKGHYFEESASVFTDVVDQILNGNLSKAGMSHKLGVMSHYISDFCCAYHSNKECRKQSLAEHLLYEFRLDRIFNKVVRSWEGVAPFNVLPHRFENLLASFIDTKMQEKRNIESDILNAVSCSYSFLVSTISVYSFRYKSVA